MLRQVVEICRRRGLLAPRRVAPSLWVVTETELPTPESMARRCAELFAQWGVADTAVDVRWNGRLSTTAGRAFVRRGCIELNPRLLARVPEALDGVLVDEAAHVAAHRLYGEGVAPHGRHWRALMRRAGHEPRVTHRLPVDGLRRRRRAQAGYLFLRMCDACGDRVVVERVRYGRCPRCSRRGDYLVVKTRSSGAGRRALERMTVTDVRAHFA